MESKVISKVECNTVDRFIKGKWEKGELFGGNFKNDVVEFTVILKKPMFINALAFGFVHKTENL